jgi:hypothetical protein
MTETKAFPTLDVLSAITGVIVTLRKIEPVYEVLNWMTGESLFTHQLPRVGEEARAVMLEFQPVLAEAIKEAELVTPDNWQERARTWLKRYGAKLMVPRMTADQHKSVDPLTELQEMAGDKPVIAVTI